MSVKKNFMYNVAYQILMMILPLITTPYIARVIGAEGVGIQSYTFSIVNYFVLFSMLGMNNYGNRSIAIVRDNKEKLNKTFSSIYSVQFIMSIIMMILYIVYICFIATDYKIFFIIQFLYIISSLFDINWFFFGIEQFKLTVVRNAIIKILSVISIFIFVKDSNDLYIYSLILVMATLTSQLILWRFIGNNVKFVRVKWEDIIVHFKPIIILFIPVIAISIYKVMDKIMLGAMSNVIQVGFYENSEKIINIPLGVITALGTVMLPKMANLQAKGENEQSKKYISMSMEFIMFLTYGAIFGLLGISNVFIPIFLGKEFNNCIKLVSVLSIALLFLAWANVIRTQFLIPNKKDKVYITSTIIGAIVNLIINLLLIGKYGAVGAAIGTVFAEASVSIYQTIKVRKELDIKSYLGKTIFYIIPGATMYLIVKLIGSRLGVSIFTGIIQISVGGLVYTSISLVYMVISKNEVVNSIINKIINKRIVIPTIKEEINK